MSQCKLTLHKLKLWTHLGCSAEEKTHLQPVEIAVTLYLLAPPPACHTDLLQNTYCYRDISERIELVMTGRHFNLIEHIGMVIWEAVRVYLDEAEIEGCPAELEVTVTKLNPPIANMHGGVSFSYRDGVD